MRVLIQVGLMFIFFLSAPAQAETAAAKILVLGDSLSAAYGIPVQQGWVALLQQRLREQGYPQRVVNASISGETTSGGLQRLPAALKVHQPQIVLIELGANDGLRGQPLKQLRANLAEIIRLSRAAGAEPVLFEMRIPSNYGAEYAEQFFAGFSQLAREQKTALVPFFLLPFAQDPAAFQDDGIHPGVGVQPQMLDAVWPVLKPLLRPKAAANRK